MGSEAARYAKRIQTCTELVEAAAACVDSKFAKIEGAASTQDVE